MLPAPNPPWIRPLLFLLPIRQPTPVMALVMPLPADLPILLVMTR